MNFSLFSGAYASAPILLCLATFGWGSNSVANRLTVGEISPMMLIFFALEPRCYIHSYSAWKRDDEGMARHSQKA